MHPCNLSVSGVRVKVKDFLSWDQGMQELRRSHQGGQGIKHIAAVVNCKQHVEVRVRSKS